MANKPPKKTQLQQQKKLNQNGMQILLTNVICKPLVKEATWYFKDYVNGLAKNPQFSFCLDMNSLRKDIRESFEVDLFEERVRSEVCGCLQEYQIELFFCEQCIRLDVTF